MAKMNSKALSRIKRQRRIRKKIRGTADCPRLCVFRSARHIYAQVIDDVAGVTLVAAGSNEKDFGQGLDQKDKHAFASRVGEVIAQRAKGKGVNQVVFDRNGFLYHGRVRAVSEGARKGGLAF